MKNRKVVLGMSGGVDSSVSALLLKQKGYDVIGVFMKNWEEDDTDNFCLAENDIIDAKAICHLINIPFKKINFSTEYWNNVFKRCLIEYKLGKTPNPDIFCNEEIKFKVFLNYAYSLGAKYIAMGHYARIKTSKNGLLQLVRSIDENKDQTYFLYKLTQDQLKKIIFPIGDIRKSEVREIAKKNNLITFNKKDSTGICFIGKRNFKKFLLKYFSTNKGDIYDLYGNKIGEHDGLMYYTIGQRHGLNIGGIKNYPEMPWFVAQKDLYRNILIVVQGHNHPILFNKSLIAKQVNWISGFAPANKFRCSAKIRYRQKDQKCEVSLYCNKYVKVIFNSPQRAITSGQSIVFYDNSICLGGGIII